MPNTWHPVPGCAMDRAGNPRTWNQKLQNLKTLPVLLWCSVRIMGLALYIIHFPLISEGSAKRTLLCLARSLCRPSTNQVFIPYKNNSSLLRSEIMSFCWAVGKLMQGESFMEDEGERWAERDLLSCPWKMWLRCLPQESSALVRHIRFVIRPQRRTSQGIVTECRFHL
jgi:hypothetical protein